jgi:hypothetical protein
MNWHVLQYVESLPNGQHKFFCERCKQYVESKYAEARFIKLLCRASRRTSLSVETKPLCTGPHPGDELISLNKSLGFTACSLCRDTAARMNASGPDWCVEHREELKVEIASNFDLIASGVAKQIDALDKPLTPQQLEAVRDGKLKVLTDGQKIKRRGALATMAEKAAMLTKGAVHAGINLAAGEFVPDATDRIGSLIDEAIRRSRMKP